MATKKLEYPYVELSSEPREIPCDLCGLDLGQDVPRGWVMWSRPYRDGHLSEAVVASFDVVCNGACAEQARRRREADARQRGLHAGLLDGHLDWYVGAWAIIGVAQLMREYRWEHGSKALERCLDFFVAASTLPTGKGHPQV